MAIVITASQQSIAGSTAVGQTFPILEPDTREELIKRASSIDWVSWAKRDPKTYAAFETASVPRALENRSRLFDPTYTLPQPLLDRDGSVLFPAGYRFNVLKSFSLPGRYIVIGPSDDDYQWLMTIAKPTSRDKVLLANGNVYEARVKRRAPLLLLDTRFIDRFGISAIPCIVTQDKLKLVITEYVVK